MTISLKEFVGVWVGKLLHPPIWMVKSMWDINIKQFETEKKVAGRVVGGIEISAHINKHRKVMGSVWMTNGRFESDDFQYGIVYSLWVHSAFRRLGIGHLLINEVRKIAHNQGKKEIFLTCRPNNKGAIKFYSRMGFKNGNESAFTSVYENELALYWPRQVVGFYCTIKKIRIEDTHPYCKIPDCKCNSLPG